MLITRLISPGLLALLCLLATVVQAEESVETISLPGGRLHLLIEGKSFALERNSLQDWVRHSADVIVQYYGRFPVTEVHVAIRGRPGRGVMNGTTLGHVGAVINIDVGIETTDADLVKDWILVHELIHLAFPSVPRRHHWIEEGLAVYVESIARANAGDLSPQIVWKGFRDGMAYGLPKPGDRGLDHTPTWGRTYWGGALFCLLADIRIRNLTRGQMTLRDGLRTIVAEGYNITGSSDLRSILEIADRAMEVHVLTELYDQMRAQPYPADLDRLWPALGVTRVGEQIVFDETAPLAVIRSSITERAL